MSLGYSKFSKFYSTVLLIIIIAGIMIMCDYLIKKFHYLRMLPAGLVVSELVYAREESWGFGPGGNETGMIVFELPPDVVSGFQQHAKNNSIQWKATPVAVEGSDGDNATFSYDIGQYLNRYGFGLSINNELTRNINDALSSRGNFVYDNGRRLIIIMPRVARLVIAYRG